MALQSRKINKVVVPVTSSSYLTRQTRRFLMSATITLFALLIVSVYLMPMASAATVALKPRFTESDMPSYPAAPALYTYQGKEYNLYKVPLAEGVRELALVKQGREKSTFIDPANPATPIEWTGRWRTLERVWNVKFEWKNFSEAWRISKFPRLFLNTVLLGLVGGFGTLISSIAVAYGFSRFPLPGKNILFLILIATIILPPQVTLIPTYTLYTKMGWTGTWLPLLVPQFFANAYNVFLLRQFFLSIPREMDEAAMIDGASPLRTLISVILPQSLPAIVAVALFHFFWSWNDFFGPLIYLVGKPNLWPISVGIQAFNATYAVQPNLIQATMIMAMIVPLLIFFFAQRFFIQGVVVTGVDK